MRVLSSFVSVTERGQYWQHEKDANERKSQSAWPRSGCARRYGTQCKKEQTRNARRNQRRRVHAIEQRDKPMHLARVSFKRKYKNPELVDATLVVSRLRPS